MSQDCKAQTRGEDPGAGKQRLTIAKGRPGEYEQSLERLRASLEHGSGVSGNSRPDGLGGPC